MSLNLYFPDSIKSTSKVILLPQHSLRELLLKSNKDYFKSGPKLFDNFIPLVGTNNELIISPFLGSQGILVLLEFLFNNCTHLSSVHFFGTCGTLEDSDLVIGKVVTPDGFYLEEYLGSLIPLYETRSEAEVRIVSTNFPLEETYQKIFSWYQTNSIALIDMEVSFIKRLCIKYKIPFLPKLIISDSFLCDGTHSGVRKLTALGEFELFYGYLESTFK